VGDFLQPTSAFYSIPDGFLSGIGTPPGGIFWYPSDEIRTPGIVSWMREAERNLGLLWKKIDLRFSEATRIGLVEWIQHVGIARSFLAQVKVQILMGHSLLNVSSVVSHQLLSRLIVIN
jgi:hypothetical protein